LVKSPQIDDATRLQVDYKVRASAKLTLDVDAAPLRKDYLPTDAEAKSHACLVLILTLLQLSEVCEQSILIVF